MATKRLLQRSGRRLAQAAATALAATVIVWALLPLAPGDPAYRILKARGVQDPTALQIQALRTEMALDQPLPAQYLDWLARVVQGDFSVSYRTGQPVLQDLADRLPATVTLLGCALAIAVITSLTLALTAAATHGRWPDRLICAYTQLGASIPTFVLALLVLQYVVVAAGVGQVLTGGATAYVALPALAIGIDRAAGWTQLLRASLLATLRSDYVLTARARGATRRRVLLRHALPNAVMPFLAAVGMSVGALLGGAPIIEEIFTWPGIGRYVLQALHARDYPVIQAFVLISALSYVGASLAVDLAALWLDPRLRPESAP